MDFNVKEVEFKAEEITEEGIFRGYASTFGGKPDSYGDIIKFAAFADTIRKGGKFGLGVGMLYQHNTHRPLGLWMELKENTKGLQSIGQLAIQTVDGHDTYIFMKMGIMKAMSIGWEYLKVDSEGLDVPIEDAVEFDDKKKIRTLKKIDLWEISPVMFPANPRAIITDVKTAIEDAKTVRELEGALKEAGLSISVSKYITKLCREKLGVENEDVNKLKDILECLKATRIEFFVSSLIGKAFAELNLREVGSPEAKPKPNGTETEAEFVSRCIPIILEEGTAEDADEAAAICHSLWDQNKSN